VSEDWLTTNRPIYELRHEAGSAGDLDMVEICDAALMGDRDARTEVAKVIAAARAQAD
jgi:hypothetical protein